MKRFGFKMKLKEGCVAEYKRRHDHIWPELKELIKSTGVYDYSIFYDEDTRILFAVQKFEGDSSSQDLGSNPVVQRWWNYMADLMEVNEDYSPLTVPLQEVFYLE